ncbi:MAG: hypothetical protein HC898_00305 [Phycisphaerales bacterium]|nr:hypothetical protein [Phycisphaerales bacterium]
MLKPYAMEDLVRYVHKHVQEHRHRNDAKAPLTSVYWSNQSMKPLITGFLERLGTQVDELDELISKDANIQILQKRCLDLKGTAGGYGFPQISEAADQLFQKLTSQAPVADRQAAHRELNGLCRRAVAVLGSSNHP